MTRSVFRTFWLFNRRREKQCIVKRVPQSNRGGDVALQMSSNAGHAYDSLIGIGNVASNDKCYANYSIQVGQTGRAVEVDDRQWSGLQSNIGITHLQNSGLAGLNVAHDGSCKFFNWDNTKGCMVAFDLSTPFLRRLARSFDAFMRSWRLG